MDLRVKLANSYYENIKVYNYTIWINIDNSFL